LSTSSMTLQRRKSGIIASKLREAKSQINSSD
jgi:hypothetical protein